VDGSGSAINFFAVQKDPVAVAGYGRIQLRFLATGGQLQRMTLDPQIAAPHGVAANHAGAGNNLGAAGQAEIVAQVDFRSVFRRQARHAFGNFDDALLALALFAAGRGNAHAKGIGAVEERCLWCDLASATVQM
jgi:hypothetical protein